MPNKDTRKRKSDSDLISELKVKLKKLEQNISRGRSRPRRRIRVISSSSESSPSPRPLSSERRRSRAGTRQPERRQCRSRSPLSCRSPHHHRSPSRSRSARRRRQSRSPRRGRNLLRTRSPPPFRPRVTSQEAVRLDRHSDSDREDAVSTREQEVVAQAQVHAPPPARPRTAATPVQAQALSMSSANIIVSQPQVRRVTSPAPEPDILPDDEAALSRRKESAAPLTEEREGWPSLSYPLAFVLRLRVLQIVCGISAIVMGSVAYIEERQKFNMGLGIPAGFSSVLAAAVSIHTSRGWGGVQGLAIRAGTEIFLWASTVCLLIALVVQSCKTILDPSGYEYGEIYVEEDSKPSSRDLIVIASVQIALAIATLLSAAICARIDCSK